MPTYSYECESCGYRFDLFQTITEEPQTMCPKCQTRSLKRLLGAGAGFLFKGSGFYITDYRSKSYQEKASQENTSKTGSSDSSSKQESSSSSSKEDKSSPQKQSA